MAMKKIASLFGVLALSVSFACAQEGAKNPAGTKDPKESNKAQTVSSGPTGAAGQPASGSPQTSAGGQVVKSGQTPVESQLVRTNEEKKAQMSIPRPTSKVLGKHVTYGGYLTDFIRAERKRPLFDLKA